MAIKVSIQNPLTQSQSQLVSKIRTMKGMLSFKDLYNKNIPKNQQMSLFDYLMKVCEAFGIDVRILFQVFLKTMFDKLDFLPDSIMKAMAAKVAKNGCQLRPGGYDKSTKSEEELKKLNYEEIKRRDGGALKHVFEGAENTLIRMLTYLVFSPDPKSDIAQNMFPDFSVWGPDDKTENYTSEAFLTNLKEGSICNSRMFSLSNNPFERNEDVEYNRIQLLKKQEKGDFSINVTCEGVTINLPPDPGFLFEDQIPSGGVGPIKKTPSKSVELLVNYVAAEVQKNNSETNSNNSSLTFLLHYLESLLSYITLMINPYLGMWLENCVDITYFDKDSNSQIRASAANTNYSGCEIVNDQNPTSRKNEFASALLNLIFKLLLTIILSYVVKHFKSLVAAFFAKRAKRRAEEKASKVKARFGLGNAEKALESVSKAARYARASKPVLSLLNPEA